MRITYDPNVDALNIHFRDGTMTSVHPTGDETISVDLDADGRITAIEVLDASWRFGDLDVLKHVTFKEYDVRQPPTPRPQVVQ